MENIFSNETKSAIADFKLPRYGELPYFELYLDQLIKIVESSLEPLYGDEPAKWLTTSMVNNYTRQNVIKRPHSKRYDRDHIAYLIFICISKPVMSISDIQKLINIQKMSYEVGVAYDYFCTEFENALFSVFNERKLCDDTSSCKTLGTFVLRAAVSSAAHQIYLAKCIGEIPTEPKSPGKESLK